MKQRDIPSLDGLRGVSIVMVVGGHLVQTGTAPDWLVRLSPLFNGELGVRVFFVISGFLITTLLLRELKTTGRIGLRNFYVRRFLRLAPVQLAFIAVLFVLTQSTGLRLSGCQFATALTYTKNYGCGAWIDGHLWSLSVEEQFYLLWPTLLAAAPRRVWLPVSAGLVVISAPSRAVEYLLGSRQFFWLTSNTDALMLGTLLAVWRDSSSEVLDRVIRWRPLSLRALALVAIVVPEVLRAKLLLGAVTVTLGPALQSFAIAYLIASLVSRHRGPSYWLLNTRPMVAFGVLSYSIYVWQQIFFSKPEVLGLEHGERVLSFPVNVFLAVAAGVASYYFLEKPFVALRRRFRPKEPTGAQSRSAVAVAG